ncbi:hypothetical protein VNI00_017330 [Paramarasmius palmivorus]|uniref:HAT C-terminal dimerisation domain-containing protein n=1 Tax=Paramarasmius palmivorus TaxID=297713 RepID=A0AAW0B692_9AGAR
MKCEGDDDQAFLDHAQAVFNKHFWKIAIPIHKLALFLHPLCHQLAVCDKVGFKLGDMKRTALGLAKKWNWNQGEAKALAEDIDRYYKCKEPFMGGDENAHNWWKSLPLNSKKHPIKSLAIIIHSIVPHTADVERLFLQLGGVQSPKCSNLSVLVFEKLATVRNSLVNELTWKGIAAGKSTHCKHAHMHTKEGPAVRVPEQNH